MMTNRKIVIATRGSMLALWQAEWIRSQLQELDSGLTVELNKIKTTGDKILDVPLAQVGGKGLFVKEIEEALLDGTADLAVHSMKDVPTELPEGLHLAAITKREDPRDALIAREGISSIKDLPKGAHVGTSSLRRICQLLSIRPDLKITQLRGNVDTRIRKLDEGRFDAIILATAGVKRLGYADRITEMIPVDISLPAIAQGAVGIECRIDDEFTNSLIEKLDHPDTSVCVMAERAFLTKLEGGCQVPIAGYAYLEDRAQTEDQDPSRVTHHPLLKMTGLVGSLSGDTIIKENISGSPGDAERLGVTLAETLLSKGADRILAEVYGDSKP
jgi:hydroxymethylbilane synthase